MDVISEIEKSQIKDKKIPPYHIGDTISISTTITGEGKGSRVQTYTGVLIAETGRGINRSVTLRRISYGEGVEKVFPVYSPLVTKIKVESKGSVRRSKLYYLRERIGKGATKVKQKTGVEKSASE